MADLLNAISIASDFIKKWEGKPPQNAAGYYTAFDDKYGNWTIYYGITTYPDGRPVKKGDIISLAEGEMYFKWHIDEKTGGITELLPIQNYTDVQIAAVISFAYTTGVAGFENSRLYAAILSGKTGSELKSIWITSYITSNGIKSQGLINRRIDEYSLYSGNYNMLYSYYLRNESTIKKTAIVIGGIALAVSGYIYFITKKAGKN